MSFEAFEVHLHPIGASCLCSADPAKMEEVLCVVQAQWPEFHPDEVEIARLYKPLQTNERLLVYEATRGAYATECSIGCCKWLRGPCDEVRIL